MSHTRVGFFVGPFFVSSELSGGGWWVHLFFYCLLLALSVMVVLGVLVLIVAVWVGATILVIVFKLWARFWLSFNPRSESERLRLHRAAEYRVRDLWVKIPRDAITTALDKRDARLARHASSPAAPP